MADPDLNTVRWTYDLRGRVTAETLSAVGQTHTTGYAYDAADRLTTTTLPDLETVTTTYDAGGRPATLQAGTTELVNSVTYDAAGRLRDVHLAGGNLWRRQNFYPWNDPSGNGRLHEVLVGPQPGSGTVLSLAYEYDPVGNVRSLTDAGTRSAFEYDDLDRLTNAYGQDFHYDVFGRFTLFAGSVYTLIASTRTPSTKWPARTATITTPTATWSCATRDSAISRRWPGMPRIG